MFPRNTHKQSKQQLRCGIVHAEENEQKSRKLAFILHDRATAEQQHDFVQSSMLARTFPLVIAA